MTLQELHNITKQALYEYPALASTEVRSINLTTSFPIGALRLNEKNNFELLSKELIKLEVIWKP
jgi:hypothetical protein